MARIHRGFASGAGIGLSGVLMFVYSRPVASTVVLLLTLTALVTYDEVITS